MLIHVNLALVLSTFLVGRLWAASFQPSGLLTQISAGDSDCNSDKLLGDFDLKTVPQFNALCNIPTPDIEQSEFLLQNNVVPILCMGLLDVSLRLCKSAKEDISRFEDIFPPTTVKFTKIFEQLSKINGYSQMDEFCSDTVKKFTINEAASNITDQWWKVLNKQLSDEKLCSEICRSNEGNKVHPLCSYILWSNGVYMNYQTSQHDGQVGSVGGDLKSSVSEKFDGAVDQEEKSIQVGFVKSELSTKATEALTNQNTVISSGNKTQIAETTKFNFTTDNNNVGIGTIEQVMNIGNQSSVSDTTKPVLSPSADKVKLAKKGDKRKSKNKIKEPITTKNPSDNSNVGAGSIMVDKPASSAGQTEVKVDLKTNNAALPSSHPDKKADATAGAQAVPESQKQSDAKPPGEPGKATEDIVEGDISLEGTPDTFGMDQPLVSEKDFPPPYPEEEGDDGDGGDVDVVESNPQPNINPASNRSSSVASITGNNGVANIQQGPLDVVPVLEDHFFEAEDSHFFTYFLCMAVLTIMAYLAFHNKKKLIALAVEGRRTKGGRRRPNSSHYSKLDCSLEEALVSNTTASVTHVLY